MNQPHLDDQNLSEQHNVVIAVASETRATTRPHTTVEIVRKPAEQRGFAVHPKRWVVERSLAWLTAHRRLARDYERDPAVSEALIRWAAINTMIRRLERGTPTARQRRRLATAPE
jgi:hypothetical protein